MERVYGTRFELPPSAVAAAGGGDQVAKALWEWAFGGAPPVPEFAHGSYLTTDLRTVEASIAGEASTSLFHLTLTHPDGDEPRLTWRATADLVLDQDIAEFALLLETQRPTRVAAPDPATPRIVRDLVKMGARSGRLDLTATPRTLTGADVDDFVEGTLLDPDRQLPVLLVTAFANGAGFALPTERLTKLAADLAAVAVVVCLPEARDTFVLAQRVGRDLRVFNGAMRMYWPDLNHGIHHVFMPERLNEFALRQILRSAQRRAVGRFAPPRLAADLLNRSQRARDAAVLEERLTAARDGGEVADLRAQLEQLLEERGLLAVQVGQLENQVRVLEARLSEEEGLRGQLEARARRPFEAAVERATGRRDLASELLTALRPLVSQLEQTTAVPSESADEETSEEVQPHDIDDALLFAMERFTSTMELTSNAAMMARLMKPEPALVTNLWKALQALDEVARLWQDDKLPKGGKRFAFSQLGEHYQAAVSQAALGKHAQEYRFTYNGQQVRVGPHLKIGRGERIYFYEDPVELKFVINHIGQHLPDGTT